MKRLQKMMVLGIGALMLGSSVLAAKPSVRTYTLSIDPQPLDAALTQLASQSGVQLAVYPRDCEGFTSPRLDGEYTLQAALERLLANTPLRYEQVNERTIAIRSKVVASSSSRSLLRTVEKSDNRTRLVDVGFSDAQAEWESKQMPVKNSDASASTRGDKSDDEVTVTGTHIRGVAPVGSAVHVFTKEDFDRVGASTIQQFLATLTQNFGGDFSDDSINAPSGTTSGFDAGYGAGVNLRGLGTGATLVLLNGHRLPKSGAGNFVDVSMIPLNSIERIEVVTDGQSAVYGSDAIGGVVNLVIRSDYQGAHTKLRGAMSQDEDAEEIQAAQSVGLGWESGNALLSYEYYRRDPVNSLDRDFSVPTGPFSGPYDLISRQLRNSMMLTAQQELMPSWKASADLMYSEREAIARSWNAFSRTPQVIFGDNKQFGGSLGMDVDMHNSWVLSLRGTYGRSKQKNAVGRITSANPSVVKLDSNEHSIDLTASGPIFKLPAGDAAIATGIGYRNEGLDVLPIFDKTDFNVRSAFVELMVPLHRNESRTDFVLSAGGRFEEYSNFGETINPRVGLEWKPIETLRVMGSYSTSFAAPSLFLSNEFNSIYQISPVLGTETLILGGNNSEVHEETSRSWTAGIELTATESGALKLQMQYFDIRYKDKLGDPAAALSGPLSTYIDTYRAAGLGIRRGDISDAEFNALVQARLSRSPLLWIGCIDDFGESQVDQVGACQISATTIDALVDARLTNLAQVHSRGIDAAINYGFKFPLGVLELGLNATYTLDQEQRTSSTSPNIEVLDTLYNSLRWRLRSGAAWNQKNWVASVDVNYSNPYDNVRAVPAQRIASWTTVDLNVRYEIAQSWLSGIAVALNIYNAFDESPPKITDTFISPFDPRTGYDFANADPVGRLFSLTVEKQWGRR